MSIMSKRFISLCLCTTLLASCKVGPDYQLPQMDIGNPFAAKPQLAEKVSDEAILQAWWQSFNDPQLTALIEDAMRHNKDIEIASANLLQARALRGVARSALFPTIDASGAATRQGISRQGSNNFLPVKERNIFDAGLDAVWELDFWGRVRRNIEAADATIEATEANRRAVMLSVMAEVAQTYLQLRGTQRLIAITEENVALLADVEQVANSEFEAGGSSELDVTRARAEKMAETAKLPPLQADMRSAIYRLGLLCGKVPEHFEAELLTSSPLPLPPDLVPVGLRSDLLRRRPDIRQAERELAASTALIGVAEAELFPQFSLTGSPGFGSLNYGDLFTRNAFAYTAGGLIRWPLFRAGEITARIDASQADAQAAAARYEQAVLIALQETEESLLRYGAAHQRQAQLAQAEATQGEALRIARLRFEAGQENFLSVLDAQRILNDLRAQSIEAQTQIVLNLVQLYKAFGGGWQVAETAATAPKKD